LEGGSHLIYYIPEEGYVLDHWKAYQGVKLPLYADPESNRNTILVSGRGEIRAFYKLGPKINVTSLCPANNSILTSSPVELEVVLTSESGPVEDVNVTFYVNGNSFASAFSDGDGHASAFFTPEENNVYRWFVCVEKSGYQTGFSDEWGFRYIVLELEPFNGEVVTDNPVVLLTRVLIDGENVEGTEVAFILDDKCVANATTQNNGYAYTLIEGISPGLHNWSVTVSIPEWGSIRSMDQIFEFQRELYIYLIDPEPDETITEYEREIIFQARVLENDEPAQNVNVSFYVDGRYGGSVLSDVNGIANHTYLPLEENQVYQWYAVASLPGSTNDTSHTWEFFYPNQRLFVEAKSRSVDDMFVQSYVHSSSSRARRR
ncbi:MAG: hypothetical protein ACFFDT_33350, partial [Candidatus Hodarchaeota archaeon]